MTRTVYTALSVWLGIPRDSCDIWGLSGPSHAEGRGNPNMSLIPAKAPSAITTVCLQLPDSYREFIVSVAGTVHLI